jgi:hypothetical protein
MRKLSLLVCLLLALGGSAAAQNESGNASSRQEILLEKRNEKKEQLEPYKVTGAEARIHGYEKIKFPTNIFVKGWRGLRPLIGGMPSGSGFVLGGGYIQGLENQYFQWQVNGRYSTKGYTTADAQVLYPLPEEGRRFEIKGRTEYRNLTSLRYYGIGNETSVDDRATYLLNDRNAFAHLWINPRGLLSFGAQAGWYSAETDVGDDEDRSEETIPEPVVLPGFGVPRTDFAVTGAWVEFDVRDKWAEPPVGIEARFTGMRYEDIDTNLFDFTRLIADVKGYIPLGHRNRILAMRFRTSLSDRDSGSFVPFYLMETLGGAKTIRGFDEFRFRDRRNLLLQIEYRWEIWAYIDMTVFLDAGKVFADMDDFNFNDLHTGYGFGLRVHTPGGWRLRFDLARSVEGIKFHVSSGPSF